MCIVHSRVDGILLSRLTIVVDIYFVFGRVSLFVRKIVLRENGWRNSRKWKFQSRSGFGNCSVTSRLLIFVKNLDRGATGGLMPVTMPTFYKRSLGKRLLRGCSCCSRRVLCLLGSVPCSAPHDYLHSWRSVDSAVARTTESSVLYIRYRRYYEWNLLLIHHVNPLMDIKSAEQRIILQQSVIGTLVVDGWAVTFGTAKRGLGWLRPRPVPSSLTKCNSPPINGQCTKHSMWYCAY